VRISDVDLRAVKCLALQFHLGFLFTSCIAPDRGLRLDGVGRTSWRALAEIGPEVTRSEGITYQGGGMALFSRKQTWEETFRINAIGRGGRGFCSVIFWIWGIGGLVYIGAEFASMSGSIGVGASSYVCAQCVYWLGGLVLFGLGALLDTQDFSGVRPIAKDNYGNVHVSQ
jgi:hypothetical protein